MLELTENGTPSVKELEAVGRWASRGRRNGTYLPADQEVAANEVAQSEDRPVLAVFCCETRGPAVPRFVSNLAGALARRRVAVHVYAPRPFDIDSAGVTLHVLGEGTDGDLLDRAREFTHRAGNAFLQQFQGCAAPITLLGCEWSAVPVLSLLHGIKNLPTVLSLHSLERQRSDLSSADSREIESLELAGLREARAVLVHEPATAEVIKYWAPESAGRVVCARPIFPVTQFDRDLDPGAVKARYQVGPIDPMILYVGDLDSRYGSDVLLKAMPAVLKRHPQARLIVVGDGAEYWPLRVFARYLLLEHAVRLPGHVEGEALYELIRAADMVAVPSREATPWWPIQAAWAARRPVLATHAAAPGLLEHEQDAVLCYPNPPSCVWGIERVLNDAALARSIAAQGRQKLDERFGWNGVAEQVEALMAGRPV